jgi:hypothetical protein
VAHPPLFIKQTFFNAKVSFNVISKNTFSLKSVRLIKRGGIRANIIDLNS